MTESLIKQQLFRF